MLLLLAQAALALVALHFLRNALKPGLVDVPGPFAAKFTDLWRLYKLWQWRFKEDLPGLHQKYNSSLIRIGPETVSCSDTRAVDLIYGFHTEFKKSDMVKTMAPMYKGKKQLTMFSAADNKTHARIRRPVAGAYSMSSIVQFEPAVNEDMKLFYSQMNELFIQPGTPCDMHNWIQYFAFDVVFDMTMSRNLGFLKAGGDVDGVLKQLQKDLDYRGIALAMPIIDRVFKLSPVARLFKSKKSGYFAMRARQILEGRLTDNATKGGSPPSNRGEKGPVDFADRLLEAQRKDPGISEGQLVGYLQTNLVAGSDTTAVVLRTAIYYTLKNPWIHKRLVEEVDSKYDGPFPIPFRVARFELPFCTAVIRESLRKHFVFMGLMEREVPAGGVQLPDGHKLPGGVVIGMHGDLIGKDRTIFGDDADEFNPLRWLQQPDETKEAYDVRLSTMNAHDLAFGHGARGCIGKHMAEMEIYKFLPTFFALLEPRFVRPEEPWKLRQLFIFKQSGMDMYLGWREGKSLESFAAA